MVEKKKAGKTNQPKSEEQWIAHFELYIQLLPKAAKEQINELINQLKDCEKNSPKREQLVRQLNDLRLVKPYNKKWAAWTKKISNITAGTITKVECSRYNVHLIDKVRDFGGLGSRRASIDFLIEAFHPVIDATIKSGEIEELPDRIKLLGEITEIQDEQIEELKEENLRLNKLVDRLQNEISDCQDPIHGIDFSD